MSYLDIDAFFPFYNEERNTHTCILFKDGHKEYVRPNVTRYIPMLFFQAELNDKAIHRWSSQLLGAEHNLPLLITDQLIFIPIKFQTQPYAPGHPFTFGYVNYNAIAFYSDKEVILKSQAVLQTLSPTKFIEKKIRDATLLSFAYQAKKREL